MNSEAAEHTRARKWWERTVNDEETIGLAGWYCSASYDSRPTLEYFHTLSRPMAAAKLDAWLAQDNVRVVREKDDHWDTLKPLLRGTGMAGNLTTDVHRGSCPQP